MTETTIPEEGSFEHYIRYGGDFVRALVVCIQRADRANLARLERAFPQMVAAFRDDTWFQGPARFAPRYNAEQPSPGKTYVGERTGQGCRVWIEEEGGQRALRHIPVHSSDGFGWGYGGSGPADLALAILTDHTGDENLARAFHQDFTWAVIASLPYEGWRISEEQVESWLRQAKQTIGDKR